MADPVENPAGAAETGGERDEIGSDSSPQLDRNRIGESPSSSTTESVHERGVVEFDLVCRGCGYNLRGLSPRGRCPECDQPVEHALHGDWLRYSDVQWVETIARGYRLQAAAVGAGLLAIIFASMYSGTLRMPWLTLAIALVVGVIALIGVWLATAKEPASAEQESWRSDRRMFRALTVAGVALQAASGYMAMPFPGGGLYVRLFAALVMIAGIIAAFRYSLNLVERIPDYALATETRTVMWGLILSYGTTLSIIAIAFSGRADSGLFMLAFGLSCTALVACLVFTVWCLTLFSRYASSLRQAAFDARYMKSSTSGTGVSPVP